MIEVKTKRAHGNNYGEAYGKAVGDMYDVPTELEAQVLADAELVEPLKPEKAAAAERTVKP